MAAGNLRNWARALKRDIVTLWLARRHPGVPWYAKLVAAAVAAYALSPIDLIPDFIPVLGYLDDLLIVPLGILLALRLIPPDVLAELRREASLVLERPRSRAGLVFIAFIWIGLAVMTAWFLSTYTPGMTGHRNKSPMP
jgi:uncharacterized membrane protein YkvA (DUF1232 family)